MVALATLEPESDFKKDAAAGCMERLVRFLRFFGRVLPMSGRWPVAAKNMEQPEKLPSADEVKATLSPHMQSVWDAAAKCLNAPTDENLAEFKKLCRPGEIMVLLRTYADSVISETNAKHIHPTSTPKDNE